MGQRRSTGKKRKRRGSRRKVCRLCADKVQDLDYKDIGRIRQFVGDRGKLVSRRVSGNCAKCQRKLTRAAMRARRIALLPYATD